MGSAGGTGHRLIAEIAATDSPEQEQLANSSGSASVRLGHHRSLMTNLTAVGEVGAVTRCLVTDDYPVG